MSAHNNLLDLMSQITNLEANISAIIMEFASKLSSLTDLHMMLVLENREGRKVCGSPHLIQSYAKGGLRALKNDLLYNFETSNQQSLDQALLLDLYGRGGGGGGGTGSNSSNAVDDIVIDGGTDDHGGGTTTGSGDSRTSVVVSDTDADIIIAEPVDVKPNLKRRSDSNRDAATLQKRSRSGNHINSEFVVNHLDQISNDGADGVVSGDMVCIPDVDDSFQPEGGNQHHPGNGLVNGGRRFQEHLFRSEDEGDVFLMDFAELNLPEMKMDFLKNVENPQSLFEKGSVEFRLLNSLLYDFGKSLAYASPYPPETPQSKLFFFHNLTKFINMFPCFKSDLLTNIKIDGKTALANLRMNARAGFNRAVLQRKKLMDK